MVVTIIYNTRYITNLPILSAQWWCHWIIFEGPLVFRILKEKTIPIFMLLTELAVSFHLHPSKLEIHEANNVTKKIETFLSIPQMPCIIGILLSIIWFQGLQANIIFISCWLRNTDVTSLQENKEFERFQIKMGQISEASVFRNCIKIWLYQEQILNFMSPPSLTSPNVNGMVYLQGGKKRYLFIKIFFIQGRILGTLCIVTKI